MEGRLWSSIDSDLVQERGYKEMDTNVTSLKDVTKVEMLGTHGSSVQRRSKRLLVRIDTTHPQAPTSSILQLKRQTAKGQILSEDTWRPAIGRNQTEGSTQVQYDKRGLWRSLPPSRVIVLEEIKVVPKKKLFVFLREASINAVNPI